MYILIIRYQKYIFKESLRKQQFTTIEQQKPVSEFRETVTRPVNQTTQTEKIPEYRNIMFQYRSSKAKSVAIIGDFNDWVPQQFEKVSQKKWEIVLKLTSGKYLYNYLIDGEVKLDPNNLKAPIENEARGFRSSVLVVERREPKKNP